MPRAAGTSRRELASRRGATQIHDAPPRSCPELFPNRKTGVQVAKAFSMRIRGHTRTSISNPRWCTAHREGNRQAHIATHTRSALKNRPRGVHRAVELAVHHVYKVASVCAASTSIFNAGRRKLGASQAPCRQCCSHRHVDRVDDSKETVRRLGDCNRSRFQGSCCRACVLCEGI